MGRKDDLVWADASNSMHAWLSDIGQLRPLIHDRAQILTDDTSDCDHLFDSLLASTTTMLDGQIVVGVARQSVDFPVTAAVLDPYTTGIHADEHLLQAAREALERTSGPSSNKGKNDPNQDPDPPRK